jgi:hypothetical protein
MTGSGRGYNPCAVCLKNDVATTIISVSPVVMGPCVRPVLPALAGTDLIDTTAAL